MSEPQPRDYQIVTVKLGRKRADGKWYVLETADVLGLQTCNPYLFVCPAITEKDGPFTVVHEKGWTAFRHVPDERTGQLLAGIISDNLHEGHVGANRPGSIFTLGEHDPWKWRQQFQSLPAEVKNWMRLWF